MSIEKFDVTTFVADIDAKISALQSLRAAVQAAHAVGALGQAADGIGFPPSMSSTAGELGQPIDLPEGAFNGKSLPACVELYLSAAKRKKTIKEISAALREGGVESTSGNFENVVTGALFRLKLAGKVLRFKDGWGLPEWYPANIRAASPAAAAKKSNTKKAKKTARKRKAEGHPVPIRAAKESSEPAAPPPKVSQQALEFLSSKPGTEVPVTEVGMHIGMGAKGARLVLGKLAKEGKIEKTGQDVYRFARPQ